MFLFLSSRKKIKRVPTKLQKNDSSRKNQGLAAALTWVAYVSDFALLLMSQSLIRVKLLGGL